MNAKSLTLVVFLLALGAAALAPAEAQTSPPLPLDLSLGPAAFAQGDLSGVAAGLDGLSLAADALVGHYLSPALDAPMPFNAVAARWLADVPAPAGLSLRLRTATAGGHWSDWNVLSPSHDWMTAESAEVIGPLLGVAAADGRHAQFQFSASFSRYAGQQAAVLRQLSLTFLDTAGGPSSQELVAAQAALEQAQPEAPQTGYPKPAVVSRDVWCVPDYGAACYPDDLEYYSVSHLIVHHTVNGNDEPDWAAMVRAIWQYHTFTLGWGDIGYNYLVDMDGVLYEGHFGGDDIVGTHAAGANAGSMALALLGTFTDPEDNPPGIPPPAAMKEAAADLFAWKADQKDIDIYDAGYLPNMEWGLPKLMGHRDVYGTTSCPGDQGHGMLPWLRAAVAERIGYVSPYLVSDELSPGFSGSGGFEVAAGGCGFAGHAYYAWSTTNPNESDHWGEWRPQAPADGSYEIQVYAPYCLTGAPETNGASYTITHPQGTSSVVVSHENNVGAWMSLGVFDLQAGNSAVIRLTELTTTDSGRGVWFDAIRLLPAAPQVANQEPAAGAWRTSRAVAFQWQPTNTPPIVATHVYVATDPGFNNTVWHGEFDGLVTSASHTFSQDYSQLFWLVALESESGDDIVSPATWFGLDSFKPTSAVETVYRLEDGAYTLGWQGQDATSGVQAYQLDYQPAGGAWLTWFAQTEGRGALFEPPDSQVYAFRSRALDAAGNWENTHPTGDVNTGQAIQLYRQALLPVIPAD
ncbi:MAG: N-acetylmuramoyl-L-alanine amidase [Candidatus Promineifilaceae bacterium]